MSDLIKRAKSAAIELESRDEIRNGSDEASELRQSPEYRAAKVLMEAVREIDRLRDGNQIDGRTSPKEAHDLSAEIADKVRSKFSAHFHAKVVDGTLPDMNIREAICLGDFLRNQVLQEVFPFLDGGVLPRWMTPAEKEPNV